MTLLWIGTWVSRIALALGAIRLSLGFFVAFVFDTHESMIAASKRYLGTSTSGEAIDQGIKVLIVGLVIGLLVKIAKKNQ